MDRIFKIGRKGTKEVAVEAAEDGRAACYKAGWVPEWCDTVDITDDITVLGEKGDLCPSTSKKSAA